MQLKPEQLGLLAKDLPAIDTQLPVLSAIENLYPKFDLALQSYSKNKTPFLLSAYVDVKPLLSLLDDWLVIDSGSFEHVFGKLSIKVDRLSYQPGSLFNAKKDQIAIDANWLLNDDKILDMFYQIIQDGEFDPECLKTDAQSVLPTNFQTLDLSNIACFFGAPSDIALLQELFDKRLSHRFSFLEMDFEAKDTDQNYASFISLLSATHTLAQSDIKPILWSLHRLNENHRYFSPDIGYIAKLMRIKQAANLASFLDAVHYHEGAFSASATYSKQQIFDYTTKIDFTGETVGQVNGLTVVETQSAQYGEPSRITAAVFLGEGDISDIESKSDLAGSVHAKAMMILSSFISSTFAQDEPLPFSSNVVFEQSYHEIDGDSASCAELYALLSALTGIPIKQNVAITGAMDQLGNILAVGGLDLKIEGFTRLALKMAPEQTAKILLPRSNVRHLNLSDFVVDAVQAGKLQLIAIDHVWHAAKELMGIEIKPTGSNKLFDAIEQRLDVYANKEQPEPSLMAKFVNKFK